LRQHYLSRMVYRPVSGEGPVNRVFSRIAGLLDPLLAEPAREKRN